MSWELTVMACLKWLDRGYTVDTIETTLKEYGFTAEQRDEIMQMVADEISRRKKGNAAD